MKMPRTTKTHGTTDYLRVFRNVMFAPTAGMTYQNVCMTLVNTILLHLVLRVNTKLETRKVNYPLINTNNRNLKSTNWKQCYNLTPFTPLYELRTKENKDDDKLFCLTDKYGINM